MAKQTYTTGQVLTAAQMTTLQANDYNQTVSAKTANYTLVAADAGTRITMSNASTTTITVNTGVFTAGDTLIITNIGAGVTTITAGTATVSTSASLALNQYDSGTLYFSSTGAAIWTGANIGDITAVTAGTGLTGGGSSGAVTLNLATTAKGDLVAGTGASTATALTVGNNGETLVADSSTSTGLRYQANFAAGKNKIINGDFRFNQRNFTSTTSDNTYGFDRWKLVSGSGCTYSAQTFATGAAPVAGYEAINFARLLTTGQSGTSVYSTLTQPIEDVRTFAGQTITVSFWAKAASGTPKIALDVFQEFGSGGSTAVSTPGGSVTISTSWTRYSYTVSVPSISGKTIGSNNTLQILFWVSAGSDFNTRASSIGIQSNTFDIWGVQVEASNTATAFQTATGTIQGELAACQRYYYRNTGGVAYANFATGQATSTTATTMYIAYPVTMRIAPSAIETTGTPGNYIMVTAIGGTVACTAITHDSNTSTNQAILSTTVSTGLVAGSATSIRANNSTTAYLGWSAEL